MSMIELNVVFEYRRALFEEIIDRLKLREIYDYVLTEGDVHELPYHNPQHCIRTALRCAELLVAEGWRLQRDAALLITAAMFHDFGHTGRPPDRLNVKIAIASMCIAPCVQEYFNSSAIREMSEIIECTEFPFVKEPVTLLQMIMRDADLMESMEPFHIKTVGRDLYAEMKCTKVLSVDEYTKAQVAFLTNARMYTTSGANIWRKTLDARINSFVSAMELEQST